MVIAAAAVTAAIVISVAEEAAAAVTAEASVVTVAVTAAVSEKRIEICSVYGWLWAFVYSSSISYLCGSIRLLTTCLQGCQKVSENVRKRF